MTTDGSKQVIACYSYKSCQDGFEVLRANIETIYDSEWDDFYCNPAQNPKTLVAHFYKNGGIAFLNITPKEQLSIVDFACKNQLCNPEICKDFVPC